MFLFNVDHAIGTERARPNVPGVIAKIKVTNGSDYFPAIAIGYDSFYIGRNSQSSYSDNDNNRLIYGPYLAFTSPIYLFDSEQFINYGVRLPVQPDFIPDDTSFFLGLDIPLGEFFSIRGEVERVFWNLRDSGEWLVNFGIKWLYLDSIGIELNFMYEPGEPLNRFIRIEYHGQF